MLPSPRVFRSRWAAVFWAAGIIWLAYDVAQNGGEHPKSAGAKTTDVTGAPVDDSDTRNAVSAFDSIKG
jgi:hypothetical protein